MRYLLLTTAAAILSGCASITPPLCARQDDPALKFGTVDGCGFVRPDAGGDGFKLPARPTEPERPVIEQPKPPHLDNDDPETPTDPVDPTDPETPVDPPVDPVDPEPPTEPEEPTDPETPIDPEPPTEPEDPVDPPKDPKPPKDKDNSGLGNGDEGDCKGKGCSDADNPGKGKK